MHICCILHRRFAGQNSRTAKLWLYGGCWVLLGSLAELGIMAVLWKQFWSDWDIAMKVVMILLHFGKPFHLAQPKPPPLIILRSAPAEWFAKHKERRVRPPADTPF